MTDSDKDARHSTEPEAGLVDALANMFLFSKQLASRLIAQVEGLDSLLSENIADIAAAWKMRNEMRATVERAKRTLVPKAPTEHLAQHLTQDAEELDVLFTQIIADITTAWHHLAEFRRSIKRSER